MNDIIYWSYKNILSSNYKIFNIYAYSYVYNIIIIIKDWGGGAKEEEEGLGGGLWYYFCPLSPPIHLNYFKGVGSVNKKLNPLR